MENNNKNTDTQKSLVDAHEDIGGKTIEQEFKTPSFIIPSKKKVQKESVFKSPENKFKTKVDTTVKLIDNKKDAVGRNSNGEGTTNEHTAEHDSQDEKLLKDVPDHNSIIQEKQTDVNKSKVSRLSPAEQLKHSQAAVPYKEPQWSAVSDENYSFEVIKNGAVIDKIDLKSKAFHVVGRLPSCDIPMEHPSLSRYHAVLQFSNGSSEPFPKGWYLFDLDSTHGTWINKNKVPPKKYHRLHVDYVVKYGGSTRLFILHGPDDDREEESELSASEMKEQRERQLKEAELLRQAELAEEERKAEIIRKQEELKGCSWGISDDVGADDEDEENPFASISTENEDLYIDDPKKSLNGYFEREGYDPPQYEFSDAGFGKRKCSVELPIDGPNGEPLVAEVVVSGKKKEAVIQCALEACRILDRHGLLRKATHESRKKKERNWEEDDYYDSDEDIYLDRTGTIEKKRQIRMNKVGKSNKLTETYESLLKKHENIVKEMEEIESKLEKAKAEAAAFENEEVDALDAYMTAIKSGAMDTKTKMKLKCRLLELKQEEPKMRKLVNIAKPASLPELKPAERKSDKVKSSLLSGVGKMKGLHHKSILRPKPVLPSNKEVLQQDDKEFVEEEDEEEENDSRMQQPDTSLKLEQKSVTKGHVNALKPSNSETSGSQSLSIGLDIKYALETAKSKQGTKTTIESEKIPETKNKTPSVKGPTLPLAAVLEQLQEESEVMDTEDTELIRKRKSKDNSEPYKKAKAGNYNSNDPDYAVWLPPENQVGDGKTHLNAKFGY